MAYSNILVRRKTILVLALTLCLVITLTILYHTTYSPEANTPKTPILTTKTKTKKALIYDSLAREYPNPDVIDKVIRLLIEANYSVDIYIGVNATLDPLYYLSEYDLVILRAHGGFNDNPSIGKPLGQYVFTGIYFEEAIEIYGKDKINDLYKRNYIAKGVIPRPGYSINELPKYVIVSPLFFKEMISSMKHGSIIIYTGCYGLDNDVLADIFLDKGARAYISFKGNVTWVFGDKILEILIEYLVNGIDIVDIYKSLDKNYKIDKYTGATLEIRYRG